MWRCDSHLKQCSKRCKHSPTLRQEIPHQAIVAAINSVVEDQGEFVQAFRENIVRIIGIYAPQSKPTRLKF
ncbi:hypothetical protein [Enterocloster clostridioformis]|uniref:hypothetical protein n=1 Tax=Enterocloster clostridioformis TaxID=1531 RepID=UPI001FA79438|nr:hypothetical protein [Enterocloster clostridioformis]